jgi:glycosyltransferase involved in cell wall biosynthesis
MLTGVPLREARLLRPARRRVLVVLPTHNERDNLGPITNGILAATSDVDVLIVDDNSPDGTGRLADEITAREKRVRVPRGRGRSDERLQVLSERGASSHRPADCGLCGLCLPDRTDLSGHSPRIQSVGDADHLRRTPPGEFENVVGRRVGGGSARMVYAGFVVLRPKAMSRIAPAPICLAA